MRLLIKLVVLLAVVGACRQEENPRASIEEMEREVQKSEELDTSLARRITNEYLLYAKANPEDSLAPHYLMRAGDIYKEVPGKGLKAINTYNRILHNYPDHKLAPRALFMMGYVFDEKYNDKERAAKSYTHFLEQYPDHPLSEDAKNLLIIVQDTLSEEEMVAKWLQENENVDTNQKRE